MAEPQTVNARPDIDIETDVHHLLNTGYGPLRHDKHQIEIDVQAGVVTVTGYVKSATSYQYFLNGLARIKGVQGLNTEGFYNDDAIGLHVARALPFGVLLTMEYGAVILEGKLPEGTTAEEVVNKVAGVPGVRRVLTAFR